MGPNSPYFELIYHDDTFYESQIDSRFIFMHKGILVIIQGGIGDRKQVLWIGLSD